VQLWSTRWPTPDEPPVRLVDVTEQEVIEALTAPPAMRVLQPVQDLTLLIWSATDSGRLILVWLSRNDGAAMWRIQFARPMRDAERDFWLKETS
jgi:hypothetical protein